MAMENTRIHVDLGGLLMGAGPIDGVSKVGCREGKKPWRDPGLP